MSSKFIYTSSKILPYVYMCVNKTTNQFYIGSRTTKQLKYPSHLDFPNYKTSSKIVKPNFEEYDWHIVAEFFNPSDAYIFEQNLIKENWENPLILNEHYTSNNTSFNPGQTRKSREKARARMLSDENPAYNQSQEKRDNMSKTIRLQNSLMTAEERSLKYGNFGDDNPAKRPDVREKLCKPRDSINTYQITSPSNEVFIIKSLNNFCKERDLNRDTFMSHMNKGKIPPPPNYGLKTRMNTIGWEIKKI